jgi:hypothetical protein
MLKPVQIIPGSVMTGAAVVYYTALYKTIIQSMDLVNTSGGAVSCTVYRVPSGGAAGAANTLIPARSVGAGQTDLCQEAAGMVLEANDTIQALGNGVTLIASGLQVIDDGNN